MLEIDMEFRKGVLFIRLTGDLTKDTVDVLDREVTQMILKNGIGNVVFNIRNLDSIDLEGIQALLNNYKVSTKYHGKALVCGLADSSVKRRIQNSKLLNYMFETSDELSAINLINL